jgi:hypothetical protein
MNNILANKIWDAIEANNKESTSIIKDILKNNPDLLYYRDPIENTWLHIISEYTTWNDDRATLNVLKCFIGQSYGSIDINFKNRKEKTAIYRLIRDGKRESVEFLIKNGADIHDIHPKHTALTTAYRVRYYEYLMTKLLLENGADPNQQDHEGQTLLHVIFMTMSLYRNYSDMIKILLNHGAKLSIVDNSGKSCIYYYHDYLKFIDIYSNNRIIPTDNTYKNIYNIMYRHIIEKIKKLLARDRIKKFLLKRVVLCPKSKYIQRLANNFH